jgi:hypothetical protein
MTLKFLDLPPKSPSSRSVRTQHVIFFQKFLTTLHGVESWGSSKIVVSCHDIVIMSSVTLFILVSQLRPVCLQLLDPHRVQCLGCTAMNGIVRQ